MIALPQDHSSQDYKAKRQFNGISIMILSPSCKHNSSCLLELPIVEPVNELLVEDEIYNYCEYLRSALGAYC